MSNKSQLELTDDQFRELVSLIPKDPKKHKKIRNFLTAAFLESVHPSRVLSLEALGGDPVMDLIIHTLSMLTGYPESSINSGTTLSSIGMTDSKITQLTGYLNKYIQTAGGALINPGDISSSDTVQSIYDLMQTKLP